MSLKINNLKFAMPGLPPGLGELARGLGGGALKGLAVAGGAALPAWALINHAQNKSKETIDHARNQAILGALGVGAIGAGSYGLQKLMAPKGVETEETSHGPHGTTTTMRKTKMASAYEAGVIDALITFKLSSAHEDKITGGKADKLQPKDFNVRALEVGRTHEQEHTTNSSLAREIAMDHLTEDPAYYKKLEKVEKKD